MGCELLLVGVLCWLLFFDLLLLAFLVLLLLEHRLQLGDSLQKLDIFALNHPFETYLELGSLLFGLEEERLEGLDVFTLERVFQIYQ